MITNGQLLIQSPFLYVQAVGSDFSDYSARGVHLRWQLRGILGDLHLPKGDLALSGTPYSSSIGFNRPDDYVSVYKALYNKAEFVIDLDIINTTPDRIQESGAERTWFYDQYPVSGPANKTVDIELRFTDIGIYDYFRTLASPLVSTLDFVRLYSVNRGVMEVQVSNQLVYKVDFRITAYRREPSLNVEVISVPDLSKTEQRYISCRKIIDRNINRGDANAIICENIEYVRFMCSDGFVNNILLVTYEDTFLCYENDWLLINKFSLSENDTEVYKRLDDPNSITIENKVDGQWPKYNDVNPATGAFTVSVNNYKDRWVPVLQGSKGIKYAVQQYLSLSRTDLKAEGSTPSANTNDHLRVSQFSYLDTLNIAATDYHVARMLGLGHIDQGTKTSDPYIYCVVYETDVALDNGFATNDIRTHVSITLPTTQNDYRYPPAPYLKPATYGISSLNGSNTPTSITLPGGYAQDGLSRFVNINKIAFPHQKPMESFFFSQELFCTCGQTIPILYGLEYQHEAETAYRKPEILHDSYYFDSSGLPETLPVSEQNDPGKPVFTHHETEEGIHHYALYSINWFSRVSPLSNDVSTNATSFVTRKPLPPINLMAQFIQKENALVLTTAPEQSILENITGADKSLARITFEWNQVHNDNYQFADEVQFEIRKQPLLMVQGTVVSVQDLPGNLARVSTGEYIVSSVTPPQHIQPNVPASLTASFAGGIFAAGKSLFETDSIGAPGINPTFIIKKITERISIENPGDPGTYLMSETFKKPVPGDLFTASQNLSQAVQWDAFLDKKVALEKFFPLLLSGSSDAANNQTYTVLKVLNAGANTEIFIKERIPVATAATAGNISYKKYIKYHKTIHSRKSILIDEDLSGEISVGNSIEIIAAGGNSGAYTVSAVFFGGHFSSIEFAQPLNDVRAMAGVLVINKIIAASSFDAASNKIIISGQLIGKELIPAYREFHLVEAGNDIHVFVIGGIQDTAVITSVPDPVTTSASGIYEVTLNNFILSAPLDTEITWYKGSIRIEEDPAHFPAVNSPNYRVPEIKVLQIWQIDISGAQTRLIAYDPAFDIDSPMANPKNDFMPIRTGNDVVVNVHPGYRLYLTKNNANNSGANAFQSADLLPLAGEGSRRTLLAAISRDTTTGKESVITAPVALLAQEIIIPLPPGVPTGPVFATRPDVYGKSTYTFDMDISTTGRQPYAVVCYRAGIRKILDTLYLPVTVETILRDLAALPADDAAFFNDRFHDLVNMAYDTTTNQFRNYVLNGYRFPNPDNNRYVIPNPNKDIRDIPFNTTVSLDQNFTVTLYLGPGQIPVTVLRPMHQIIRDAIDGAFLSLTAQPILYRYLKDARITSAAKPKIRNSNGDMITPGDPVNFYEFDPFPMAVKYQDNSQVKLRFTDYTLDGAADTCYFYYGVEINSRFEVSDRSPVAGPISLINTMPAEAPAIKEIISIPADILRKKGPQVSFKINNFIDSEKVKRIRIYRTTRHRDAASVRTMTLANELSLNQPLIDDFHTIIDLPYGEPLFYRIVALREIINEQGLIEYVPSKPSEISLTNIIDEVNPPTPELSFSSSLFTTGDIQIMDVVLSWQKTVHNGSYIMYKLNSSGNWVKFHELAVNDPTIHVPLATTPLRSGNLDKLTAGGDNIYHHFKVVAVNSSNLMSIEENLITI
ncbi:MAG: hypothetical protein ABI760_09215 [Ferruginibacter sp.]